MNEHTSASQATSSAELDAAPPHVSHRRAFVATGLLLTLWAITTFAARPLNPLIQDVATQVELALGLDVMLGPPPEKPDAKKKGEK